MASQRGTGGMVDRGTVEEDDPVTREILVFLAKIRRSGEPVTRLRRVTRKWTARGTE